MNGLVTFELRDASGSDLYEACTQPRANSPPLDHADSDHNTRQAARKHLDEIKQEAAERRKKLVRQLSMADEFIDLIDDRLG